MMFALFPILQFLQKILYISGVFLVIILVAFFTSYYFERKKIRERGSRFSTTVGNVFMRGVIAPWDRKPKTEQVVKVKRKRLLIERRLLGLEDFEYCRIKIRGYRKMPGQKCYKQVNSSKSKGKNEKNRE